VLYRGRREGLYGNTVGLYWLAFRCCRSTL